MNAAPYSSDDFRAAFLVIIQGMVHKNGLMMADVGHYTALVTNATGLAIVAAQAIERQRRELEPPVDALFGTLGAGND